MICDPTMLKGLQRTMGLHSYYEKIKICMSDVHNMADGAWCLTELRIEHSCRLFMRCIPEHEIGGELQTSKVISVKIMKQYCDCANTMGWLQVCTGDSRCNA